MAAVPHPKLKRGPASLFGGLAVGFCILLLWLGAMHEIGATGVGPDLVGVLLAAAVAAWVRVADL